jgi:hypothetical protein
MHFTNIIIHIIAGSLALLAGTLALIVNKGAYNGVYHEGKIHRRSGRFFLGCLSVVIFTGLLGVFIFHRNTFLLVITVLSGYLGFSGYRALQLKASCPAWFDNLTALAALTAVAYFLWYFHSIGMIWSPVIIYSTVGYLLIMVAYDLSRNFVRPRWRLYEHILKMVSAWSGLLSAFCGTVFPQYQPYSQFLPSVFGTLVAVGFMVRLFRSTCNKRHL